MIFYYQAFTLLLITIRQYDANNVCHDVILKDLDADYVIAGFIPAHLYNTASGKYELDFSVIGYASAFIYAIQQINKNKKLLSGVNLGYVVRDTCDEREPAINYTVEYFLDPSYLSCGRYANTNKTAMSLCAKDQNSRRLVVGVVGAASSPISSAINTIFSSDFIPQVSYASTSTVFSKKSIYRSFLRTVPSDYFQAMAIVDLLKYFDWSYFTVLASDDEYGRVGYDELREQSKRKGICVAGSFLFSSPLEASSESFDEIMTHLETVNNSSHVVVIWSPTLDATTILQAAGERNLSNIIWIGTETWIINYRLHRVNLPGRIFGLDIYNADMKEFKQAFLSDPNVNCKNPWFKELGGGFCQLLFSRVVPLSRYQQVIAAIYTLAYGLHDHLNCTSEKCSMPDTDINYKQFYQDIVKQDFIVPGSDVPYRVNFDKSGEFKSNTFFYTMHKSGEFFPENVGNWTGVGTLFLNESLIPWGKSGTPKSICSEDCLPGTFRVDGASDCCWSCAPCEKNSVTNITNAPKCEPCGQYKLADLNNTQCVSLRQIKIEVGSTLGICLILITVLGICCTLVFMGVFIWFWNTPVIKSSSRELSMIQLTSLLILFALPIITFIECNEYLCMARTLIFGFFLSTVIAIIVVKTYRLLRVFNGRFTKISKYLQNQYQILFVYVFVLIQLVVVVIWYLYRPVKVSVIINEADRTFQLSCGNNSEVIFFIVLAYIFLLALISAFMAFRARSLPENFNEAQYIFLSMFTVCVIWPMYLPLHFSFSAVEKGAAFLIVNFLTSLTILLVLYSNKIRIVVFKPHMNSPEYFRKTATKATVTNFQRDIELKDGGSIRKMMSVITFEHFDSAPTAAYSVPTRRYSVGTMDRDTPEDFSEITRPLSRRASFTSMTLLNRERLFDDAISKNDLLKSIKKRKDYINAMKRSQSTPDLLDMDDLSEKPKVRKTLSPPSNFGRPVANFMRRVVSSNSIHRMLSRANSEENDNTELLTRV